MRLRDLCNSSTSTEFLTIQNHTAATDSEALICTLSKEKLHAAEQAFRANLNPLKPLQVSSLAPAARVCHWHSDIFQGFQSRNSSLHFQNCLEAVRKKKDGQSLSREHEQHCFFLSFFLFSLLLAEHKCVWFAVQFFKRRVFMLCRNKKALGCPCVLVKCCVLAGTSLDIRLACAER